MPPLACVEEPKSELFAQVEFTTINHESDATERPSFAFGSLNENDESLISPL